MMVLKQYFLILLMILLAIGTDARTRRKRRGVWPDILAPGANTFSNLGYYGMQSYIAYPESGIALNPYWQNPYYSNYNPNFYNPSYSYGYGEMNMNNGIPYSDPINYNPFNLNNFGMMSRRTATTGFNRNNRPSPQAT